MQTSVGWVLQSAPNTLWVSVPVLITVVVKTFKYRVLICGYGYQKIKYPVLIYDCGCQVLQECQLITQKAAGSFTIPGGSLRGFLNNSKRRFFDFFTSNTRNRWVSDSDISRYPEPMVIEKIHCPTLTIARHENIFDCPSFTRARESARSPSASDCCCDENFGSRVFAILSLLLAACFSIRNKQQPKKKQKRIFIFVFFLKNSKQFI
jgi:hypothetical protein